jgi:hypothetical protein
MTPYNATRADIFTSQCSSLSMTSAAALKKTLVGYFSRGQEGSFLDELVLRSRQGISAAPNVRYKMHIFVSGHPQHVTVVGDKKAIKHSKSLTSGRCREVLQKPNTEHTENE